MRTSRRAMRPDVLTLDDRCLLSGLTPAQVTHAYGLDAVQFSSPSGAAVKGDGTGQTIALVEAYHDPSLAADLQAFNQAYNLPAANLAVINLAGAQTDDGWAGEEALDVEWAHAVAPGAKILVVEAKSQGIDDLMAAVDAARNAPGVSVVSMSWGFSESPDETRYDGHFTTPAGHQGVTFVAASGDSGAQAGAQWPSSSPNVVSVGGTSLSIDAAGNYLSESIWSGTGGGYSRYEAEPAYQLAVQSSGRRSTPDVAFDASPNTGVQVYSTTPSTGRAGWEIVGGTSLGAPAWAAIVAIADEGLALKGQNSLDGASQTLPSLYALPAADFHAVTTSSRFPVGGGRGGFGFPGFGGGFGAIDALAVDPLTSTGRGTPAGASLVTDLAATSILATPPTGLATSGSSTTPAASTQPTAPTEPTTPTTPTGGHKKRHKAHKAAHPKAAAVKAHAKVVAAKKHLATHDAALAALA